MSRNRGTSSKSVTAAGMSGIRAIVGHVQPGDPQQRASPGTNAGPHRQSPRAHGSPALGGLRAATIRSRAVHSVPERRDPVVLTLAEAAEQLRISAEHARKLALRGELPGAFRLGRRHLVSVEDLNRYLADVTTTVS